jgi:4-hydroxybenzoate polyprenyltransferase/phosphoserine phosphatase
MADQSRVESRTLKLNISDDVSTRPPLCVDLDGTLIRTDMLWESLMALLARNPVYAFLLPIWLLRGRAYLKSRIATHARVDARLLPYCHEFLDYLRYQRGEGRSLVLVTASDHRLAEEVANHLGLFDAVLASNGIENLKGTKKRAALDHRFGPHGYDYAGNSAADVAVWAGARRAIVVNASKGVQQRAARVATVDCAFEAGRPGTLRILCRAARVHQWIKNTLLLLPVLTSHQVFSGNVLWNALAAIVAFSLCASSVYVLNDLVDLKNDRGHPFKRKRPLASGDLSIPAGLILMIGEIGACAAVASRLPAIFQATLACYFVLTLAYSLSLKRRLLLDVLTLGGLYTIRVLAGSAATGIEPSPWLLAFCMFFFLSLALLKRFTEVHNVRQSIDREISGRGYQLNDEQALSALGTASGLIAVLVLALYINSPQVLPLYRSPWVLWFLCPFLLYWISRVWIFGFRGKLHEDPVLFALRDRVSYLAGACCGLILALASHGVTLP